MPATDRLLNPIVVGRSLLSRRGVYTPRGFAGLPGVASNAPPSLCRVAPSRSIEDDDEDEDDEDDDG
jgi:hypothetical protein